MPSPSQDYNYSHAGLDGFMSKTIDGNPANTLNYPPNYMPRVMNYDQSQVGGQMPDQLSVGNIVIDGTSGKISIFDKDGNEAITIGNLG